MSIIDHFISPQAILTGMKALIFCTLRFYSFKLTAALQKPLHKNMLSHNHLYYFHVLVILYYPRIVFENYVSFCG